MKEAVYKHFMTFILLCVAPIISMAEEVEIDGINYELIPKAKIANVIAKTTKYQGNIVIPSSFEYEGISYEVTKIKKYAFSGCSSLTSIDIPNSVTSIERDAFSNCNHLKKVIVRDIAAWCNVNFEVNSNPLLNAGHLYSDEITEITELIIPNSVTSIRSYTFEGCSGLTSIDIPNSVTSFNRSAFSGCSSLTSITVSLQNPIYDSRENCNAIIETASNELLYGCQNTIIPNSVTSIGNSAFSGCSGLTSIDIPNSVTNIGDWAFSICSSLTSIDIPSGVTSIGQYVFGYCKSLTSVNIPKSVRTIGHMAFFACDALECFYCHASTVPNTNTNAFNSSYVEYATLFVPDESIDAYKSTAPWSNFGTIKGLSGQISETEKCATPTIHYANGQLSFECETEGVVFNTSITTPDAIYYDSNTINLTGTYYVKVFASKSGYEDSDEATATINMLEGAGSGIIGDIDGDGLINMMDVTKIINIILGK